MEFTPYVSIVIPVHNGSNYLRGAIDSALKQTYKKFEVIVINDGSNDGGKTEEIACSFGNRIRYYYKDNGGVSSALNFGLSVMRGDYFSWLSHDDLYYPQKLEKQVNFIYNTPGVDIVASGLDVIDSNGRVISCYTPGSVVIVQNGKDVMDHWVYGCSLLINRRLFDRVGCFNENNRTIQDLELWIKMVYAGVNIYMMPDVLCQWRNHGESDSWKLRGYHFEEVEKFFDGLLEKYPMKFFCNDGESLDNKKKAAVYNWFGEQARHRGAVNKAKEFYLSSWAVYPNPFQASFRASLRKYLSYYKQRIIGILKTPKG